MKLLSAKRLGLKLFGVLLVLTSVLSVFGASGDVDTGFDPKLTIDIESGFGRSMVLQPDGKMLVFGSYSLNGSNDFSRPFFKRLNTDGSIDTTFNCPACVSFLPKSVAVQPDGKILVGGSGYQVFRVNQNGSFDSSFRHPFSNTGVPCAPEIIIAQPDGKSLIQCDELQYPTLQNADTVRRLKSDGSLDTTFATIIRPVSMSRQFISRMILLPDGKILLGGSGGENNNQGWLSRYDVNGNLDGSFQADGGAWVTGIELLPDGNYLVASGFSSSGGRGKIAKLFPDGSLNTKFAANTASNEVVTGLKLLPNGQFYISLYTDPFPIPGNYISRFVRYNADGSVDNTFSQTFLNPGGLEVDDLNRIITSAGVSARYYRLNIDGSVDQSFNPVLTVDGYVTAAALQNDGKLVIAGEFAKTNGVGTVRFTRVNSDGTTDMTFNSGSGFDVAPTKVAVQPDGKILVSGLFTVYNGTPRTKLVRINADGSLDSAFSPNLDADVYAIAPLANGKVLIGGTFTTVNGATQAGLARFNTDGSLDTAFNPVIGAWTTTLPATVYTILVQANGQIMAGGRFDNVNGLDRDDLARFNSDGSLDGSFDSSAENVGYVLQRPDGKYIVANKNNTGNSQIEGKLYLLNNNGTKDFSFREHNVGSSQREISTFLLQPTGNIVFGGRFPTGYGQKRNNLGRIGPSGQDDLYFPTFGANSSVSTMIGQPDGKIIFAGNFSGIEDVPRSGIARLTLSNRISGTLFDYDGDLRSDVSVFRPSTNTWYELLSGDGSVGIQTFGISGDVPAPADYDGDGKTDVALFRPSIGDWLILFSSNSTLAQTHFGQLGDIPVPSDATADGRSDIAVYRPSTGVWYRTEGGSGSFGLSGDKPLIGDFDGDGKADAAVFRPSSGDWWYAATSAGGQHRAVHWGADGDVPVPADYDGDGKTDFAVFRPSNGGWYIFKSTGGHTIMGFGVAEDKPVAADYDGDGKADIAVFRPSTGIWYLLQTTSGFSGVQWGVSGDIPTQNAFIP